MKEPARLVRRRFAEVVAYFEHPYANAVLEGADSVVRNVKRRACGFRDMDYFATMVYLTCVLASWRPLCERCFSAV